MAIGTFDDRSLTVDPDQLSCVLDTPTWRGTLAGPGGGSSARDAGTSVKVKEAVTVRAVRDAAVEASWLSAFVPLAEQPTLAGWSAGLHATGLIRRLTGTPETVEAPICPGRTAVPPKTPDRLPE
jgi:hypothetical protein